MASEFFSHFIQQLAATSLLEWIAVILAISYLYLVIKESRWCWPAAFFSTSIYIFLFFDVNLYMESALNLYYLIMAIYGWFQWQDNSSQQQTKVIIAWPFLKQLKMNVIALLLSVTSAFLLNKYTNQELAFLDSLTTWFAILATYMVTQKVLQNWLYWIVIDCLSIYLYLSKGYALTTILFMAYVLIAIVGYRIWKRQYEDSRTHG